MEDLQERLRDVIVNTCNKIGCKNCGLKWDGGFKFADIHDVMAHDNGKAREKQGNNLLISANLFIEMTERINSLESLAARCKEQLDVMNEGYSEDIKATNLINEIRITLK